LSAFGMSPPHPWSMGAGAEWQMSAVHGFQPHRVHPRFGPVFELASRAERGVPALVALLGGLLMDTQAVRRTEAHEETGRIAVCGFPRTGTTYLMHALELALGGRTTAVKSHDALAVERLTAREISTVLTLRDPASTIASWSLYHGDEPGIALLRWWLATYTAWHRVALRAVQRHRLLVVPFSRFTGDTPSCVQLILEECRALGPVAYPDFATAAQQMDAGTDQANLRLEHQNLPSRERSRRAQAYVDLLNGAELAEPLNRAYEVTRALHGHARPLAP